MLTLFSSLTLTSGAVSAWVDNARTLLILVISTFCFLVCNCFFFLLVDMEKIDSSTSQETTDEQTSTTTKRTHDRLGCTLNSRKKNALYHSFAFFFLFSFDSFFLLVATKGWGLTESTVSFPLHSSFNGYSSFHTFMSSPSVSNRTVLVRATKKRNVEISLGKATYQTDSLR